jgi:hypothetical protein
MSFLWGCSNGIIDLKEKKFHPGTSIEFDSKCSPYQIKELMDILEKTFPIKEELDLFFDQLYLAMTEQVQDDTIVILSGGPRSGKSIIQKLIQVLFGDYMTHIHSEFISKDEDVTVLPLMDRTRLMVLTEVKKVNYDLVSKITRGTQSFRELYNRHGIVQKKVSIWCFTDEKFEMDPKLNVIHIPFRSEFTKHHHNKEYSFIADGKLWNFINKQAEVLLWIILHR